MSLKSQKSSSKPLASLVKGITIIIIKVSNNNLWCCVDEVMKLVNLVYIKEWIMVKLP